MRKATVTEDVADLSALYSNIPTDPDELRQSCDALREEISQHRKRRRLMFDELVTFQAQAGTSGRMGEYRRLIGAGCGGVPPSEVDQVLGMLLEVCMRISMTRHLADINTQTLESEEPSSSSIAWSASKPVPVG